MSTGITIPALGKPDNVKDAVIITLSHNWPLSLKNLHNHIKKMGFDVSYQAVYKTARDLEESEILVRHGKNYELNLEWVHKIEEFGSTVGAGYKNGQMQRVEDLIQKDFVNLTFETMKELIEFCVPVFVVQYPNPENKIGVCNFCHIYPMVGFSEKVYKYMKVFFTKYKFYSLCKHNTALDQWFGDFLRKMGKRVKLGSNFAGEYDTIVVGDYVMQVFFTKEFKNKIDDLFQKTKNVGDASLEELLSCILEKRTEINAVIFKNPKVADQIREDTLEHFKRGD